MSAKRIGGLLCAVLLAVSLVALPYNTSSKQVFTSMLVGDLQQLLGMMYSDGLRFATERTSVSGETVTVMRIEFRGLKAGLFMMSPTQLFVPGSGIVTAYRNLQFYSGFDPGLFSVSCTKVNEWNAGHRGARAYVNGDGNAILEADLYIDTGVTVETVLEFIQRYYTTLEMFKNYLD